MVVADRHGREVREEIEDVAATPRIEQPRTLRFPEVHDDVVPIRQHVA
jgi:hypothetical protein